MKTEKFTADLIFPIFYDNGLLFKWVDQEYLLFKNNKIISLKEKELKDQDIKYPDNIQEILELKSAIDFIYNRVLISQKDMEGIKLFNNLKRIINDIEMTNEKILYEKLKIKFEESK